MKILTIFSLVVLNTPADLNNSLNNRTNANKVEMGKIIFPTLAFLSFIIWCVLRRNVEHVEKQLRKQYYKTPLANLTRIWTGIWPHEFELPFDERRETACPMTLNESHLDTKPFKRWPDVVGVGMPKCGTGTLAFFDCHPAIVFREAEANFWLEPDECNYHLHGYAVPRARVDQVLIEKTPHIINGNYEDLKKRAQCMRHMMPDVRIMFHVCDPVKRFISHAKHVTNVELTAMERDKLTIQAKGID